VCDEYYLDVRQCKPAPYARPERVGAFVNHIQTQSVAINGPCVDCKYGEDGFPRRMCGVREQVCFLRKDRS
jgi:hypothetical protein